MPGRSSAGCRPNPRRRRRRAEIVATEQRMRLDERAEVLARLERRHGEDVVAAELGADAVAHEDGVHPRVARLHALLRHAEQLDDVARRELRVREDDVAACAPYSGTSLRAFRVCGPAPTPGSAAVRGRGPSSSGSRHAAADTSSPRSGARRSGRGTARRPAGRGGSSPGASACANGRNRRRGSTGIPASAAGIAFVPCGLVGAKATISCSPAAASASPASDPRRYVAYARPRV